MRTSFHALNCINCPSQSNPVTEGREGDELLKEMKHLDESVEKEMCNVKMFCHSSEDENIDFMRSLNHSWRLDLRRAAGYGALAVISNVFNYWNYLHLGLR